jgi:hypothetical protein
MLTLSSLKPLASFRALGWAVAALVLATAAPGLAQPGNMPPPEDPAWSNFKYQPAKTCTNNCHGQPGGGNTDLALMCENLIWKSYDKHAQAYAVLEGERGQKMATALKMDVTKEEAGCLNGHGMF